MRSDRRALLAAAAAVALLPRRADAQAAVACVNCSTTWQQLMQYGTQLKQHAVALQQRALQAASYARQGAQFANQVQNTINLPFWIVNSVRGDVEGMLNLVQGGGSIATNMRFMAGNMASYGYSAAAALDAPGRYETWAGQAKQNIESLSKTLGFQIQRMPGEAARVELARQQLQNAGGQKAAIQAHAQISEQAVTELVSLRAAALAQAQFAMNAAALEEDRRQAAEASLRQFTAGAVQPMNGGRRF